MLPQLTDYLVQFHQVHLPSVGTVRLVQQPAVLDVAEKRIAPPQFQLQFSEDGWLTKHQLWFLGRQLQTNDDDTRLQLEAAGKDFRNQLEHDAWTWTGVGSFQYVDEKLLFEPNQIQSFLKPVAAERVLREGVQHSVLVGDQVVLSNGQPDTQEVEARHWNWRLITGWSVVVLCLFFIVFYLYQHQFVTTAIGWRQHISAAPPTATYSP